MGKAFKVLETDYHLSYPHVFGWQGETFMLPETRENQTIELYRCVEFPGRWELETVLMSDVNAVDATLAVIDGRWWMFVNMAVEGASMQDELHLYHARSPLGPWTAHRRNPVKSDVRSARPAGRLFTRNGELCRPGQDCSERYGYAISINRIDCIDPDRYQEVEIDKILPTWSENLLGTHTLNVCGDLTVTDGLARVPKYSFGQRDAA